MKSYRIRSSRWLLGLLVVLIVAATAFTLQKLMRAHPIDRSAEARSAEARSADALSADSAVASPQAGPADAQAPDASRSEAGPVITQTPAVPVADSNRPAPDKSDAKAGEDGSVAAPTTRRAVDVPFTSSKAAFTDAQAKGDAGDLLAARDILMAALNSNTLTAEEHEEAVRRITGLNDVIVFSSKKFPKDDLATYYKVQPGDRLQSIARRFDVPWEFIGRLNNITDPRRLQAGATLKIYRGPFHAVVDKKNFTLDVFAGGKPGAAGSVFLKRFRVGLGENDTTPTGLWQVEAGKKLKNPTYYSPRETGPRVIAADDPQNPLGERWIGLLGLEGAAAGKESYGIHGTIDPDSIGQMKSMGCIRLKEEDVDWVYDMLLDGKSTVKVVD